MPAVDGASVDQSDQFATSGSPDAWFCGISSETKTAFGVFEIDWDEFLCEGSSPNLCDPLSEIVRGWRLKYDASIFDHAEGDARVGEGEKSAGVSDVCRLSCICFEELAACWDGVEELRYLDGRADGHTAVLLVDQFAAIDRDFGPVGEGFVAGPKREA